MFIGFFLFSFSFISYLLFFVNCQNVPYSRDDQMSALVGTRLYFFGGFSPILNVTNEVWYLDLSNSSLFDTATPTWYKDVGMPIGNFDGTACVSTTNDSNVFIIGGRQTLPNTLSLAFNSSVYKFDPKNHSLWSIPNITNFNSSFNTRNEIQAAIDNKGRIFIFGGMSYFVNDSDNSPFIYYNDMNILDITTMSWSTLVISQAPSYSSYTATLLTTGIIVYIGGRDNLSGQRIPVNMSEIRTFDTTSLIWSTKPANGSSIGSRVGHSAVLNQNGDIIIYGGSELEYSKEFLEYSQSLPDLCVLNTNSWIWSIPNIPSTNIPHTLSYHSAALYNNYMVVAFGVIASTGGLHNKNVYVLDIQKYTWVGINNTAITSKGSSTSQKAQTNKAQSPSNSSSSNGLFIGIGVVSGVVVVGIASFVGFLLYKRKHKSQHKS
ncbi:galactose oxidase [Gigaspora margarita]|uniref:Galactose oxidase n=1 Tax=Gigaspora margarita TaxID=4874 RepID=A0A8H4EJ93_GIGMA|nr:galactose oxidase [Gigaspora margarita]